MNTSEKLYIILMLSFAFSMAFSITIGYLFMLGQVIENYIPELYEVYHSYMMIGGLIGSSAILITASVYQVSTSMDEYTAAFKDTTDTEKSTTNVNCESCLGCVKPIEEEKDDDEATHTPTDYMYL